MTSEITRTATGLYFNHVSTSPLAALPDSSCLEKRPSAKLMISSPRNLTPKAKLTLSYSDSAPRRLYWHRCDHRPLKGISESACLEWKQCTFFHPLRARVLNAGHASCLLERRLWYGPPPESRLEPHSDEIFSIIGEEQNAPSLLDTGDIPVHFCDTPLRNIYGFGPPIRTLGLATDPEYTYALPNAQPPISDLHAHVTGWLSAPHRNPGATAHANVRPAHVHLPDSPAANVVRQPPDRMEVICDELSGMYRCGFLFPGIHIMPLQRTIYHLGLFSEAPKTCNLMPAGSLHQPMGRHH